MVTVSGPRPVRPTASREPSAEETHLTAAIPPGAFVKAEPVATASGSVYHSPCSSMSDRVASVSNAAQRSTTTALPSPSAALDGPIFGIGIDALLGPPAATLHSIDDLIASMPAAPPGITASMPVPSLLDFQRQQGLPSYMVQEIQDPMDAATYPHQAHSLSTSAPAAAFDDISLEDALGAVDTSDLDLDLALAGILDPVSDSELPPPPPYVSPDAVMRLSLKLFSCMPTDLPSNLREELERMTTTCTSLIEGCVRPGCTHLTMDLRVPAEEAERLLNASPAAQQARLVELAGAVPSADGALAQLGRNVAVVRDGAVLGAADAGDARAPRLAALSRVCVAVDEVEAIRVDLYGANIGRPGDIVLCRQHGRHVTVEMLETDAWAMADDDDDDDDDEDGEGDVGDGFPRFDGFGSGEASLDSDDASATGVLDIDIACPSVRSAASSDAAAFTAFAVEAGAMPAVSARLLGLRIGVAEVEMQVGGMLSAPRPLLVLPDAAAAAEVESLACRSRRAPWLESFLRDAGMVVAHICSEGAAARAPAPAVEALAARTAAYCAQARCPALGRLLRRAQTALRRSLCTDDTADAMATGHGMSSKGKGGGDICGDAAGDLTDFAAARTLAIEQDMSMGKGRDVRAPVWSWSGAVGVAAGMIAMALASRVLGGGHI